MDLEEVLKSTKLFILVLKVGGDVFVKTLTTLYSQEKPIEENILKVTEVQSNAFYPQEKSFLRNLKAGKTDIRNMDISLSFKLIQLTCGLEPKNSCVWSKNCPPERQNSLEYLLLTYKNVRNNIAHSARSLGPLSENEFMEIVNQYTKTLSAIVEEVGKKSQLPKDEIISWISKIEYDTHTICERIGIIEHPSSVEKSMSVLSMEEIPEEQMALLEYKPDVSSVEKSMSVLSMEELPEEQMALMEYKPDVFSVLKKALLKVFYETDVDQSRTEPLEKSNRLYWVDRLITSEAFYNSEQNLAFWKEYEKYLE